jgi:hypothetical protein
MPPGHVPVGPLHRLGHVRDADVSIESAENAAHPIISDAERTGRFLDRTGVESSPERIQLTSRWRH